ncbi:hypothetical protein FRB94_013566 [Tulasnella sp. JGI-2019a]|nr:hypothetical protein FRB94_013566 [Tulasnella sp. JGI-2019a]
MIGRQCALQAYQSHHQEAVMNVIVKGFPGTDVLSRSLAAKKNLDKGKGSGEEAKDLSDKLHDIVLEHRMQKNLEPDPPESSGST